VPSETGPRWYETPLWFVAQVAMYVAIWGVASVLMPRDVDASGRAVVSLVILGVLIVGSAWIRGRLRRRDG